MQKLASLLITAFVLYGCGPTTENTSISQSRKVPPDPLDIGYSVAIKDISTEKLTYAKSVGIDYIELSGLGFFVDDGRNFKLDDAAIIEELKRIKAAADGAGIGIWSIHMPYGADIDLSIADEQSRKEVVGLHKKLLKFLATVEPEIILFHPSYYLGLNERETRKSQLIRSANELNEAVQEINATMVIENMLGYELLRDDKRERPLFRTVEETAELMGRLPESIGLAIDMNHIMNPENLIRAMGERLKTVHIADGSGKHENHYFPCAGEGQNNWVEILSALHEVGYNGPFMYECAYNDEQDLVTCYNLLYNAFIEDRVSTSRNGPSGNRTGMLILGSSDISTLKERVKVGYELYESGTSFDYIIVSGGCGAHGSTICEASEMAELLIERGIPTHKIFKEEKSQNTKQNYCYSRALTTADGTRLINPNDRLYVVSNHWHAISVAARFTVYDHVRADYHIRGSILPKKTDMVDYTNIFDNGLNGEAYCL